MRRVREISHDQLQRMPAGTQFQNCFGLSAAEMKVMFVLGKWTIQGRQVRIHEQVVMTRSGDIDAGRRDAHILQPEDHVHRIPDRFTVRG